MKLKKVIELLDAKKLNCSCDDEIEVCAACGSDMMSDVLAHVDDQSVLITGLCNPQVIRTAEMMDIVCIIMVRNKMPDEAMIEMAEERGICLLATALPMFTACGILYDKGIRGGAHHGE